MKRMLVYLLLSVMLFSACQVDQPDTIATLKALRMQNQILALKLQEAEEKIREFESLIQTPTIGMPVQSGTNEPLTIEGLAEMAFRMIQEKDFLSLAQMVHPELGLRISPNLYIELDSNLVFKKDEVAAFGSDERIYSWGIRSALAYDTPMTVDEYWNEYVILPEPNGLWSDYEDFTERWAHTIDNIAEAYPGLEFVDYYHPGTEERLYSDFRSLRLVFSPLGEDLYLVGIVHDEWTP